MVRLVIGNEPQGMKAIHYLNPSKAEGHTLAPGFFLSSFFLHD